jgi:hypothetical protein
MFDCAVPGHSAVASSDLSTDAFKSDPSNSIVTSRPTGVLEPVAVGALMSAQFHKPCRDTIAPVMAAPRATRAPVDRDFDRCCGEVPRDVKMKLDFIDSSISSARI